MKERNLKIAYISALSLIALVIISSHLFIRNIIKKNKQDSLIINISGRQRMLSQRITQLSIRFAYDIDNNKKNYNELDSCLVLWKNTNITLQYGAYSSESSKVHNTPEIEALFSEIEPAHQAILSAANQILLGLGDKKTLIDLIINQQDIFLSGMDAITKNYQKESEMKLIEIQEWEFKLLILALIVLLLEALFIFSPLIKRVKKYFMDLTEKNVLLENKNKELEQFSLIISQDLKAPLRNIRHLLDLIEEDLMMQMNEETNKLLNQAKKQSEVMKQMIDDLLQHSRSLRQSEKKE